jgi:hypothetical protein
VLYDRARQLQGTGLSDEEVSRTLLAEGARPEDVKVILGSLGLGPQPQPDPTQRPLQLARRLVESRALRVAVLAAGTAVLGGVLAALWSLATIVGRLADAVRGTPMER